MEMAHNDKVRFKQEEDARLYRPLLPTGDDEIHFGDDDDGFEEEEEDRVQPSINGDEATSAWLSWKSKFFGTNHNKKQWRRSLIMKSWGRDVTKVESQDEAAHCAAVLIWDALHGRNVRHRMDSTALKINRLIRSTWYSALYASMVLIDMALAVVERPSSFREQRDRLNEHIWPLWTTTTIELLCMVVFAADVALRYRYLGHKQFRHSTWALVKLAFICLAVVNAIVVQAAPVVPRFHRVFRPILLAAHFRNVSKIFGNMISSIPRIRNVFLLVLFHILFFGVFVHIAFGGLSDSSCDHIILTGQTKHLGGECTANPRLWCSPFDKCCTDYFGTFTGTLNQLFILLTTANFPDVMMPVYACNPWYTLVFVVYLMIGLFFIMNLILAVAYTVFQDKTRDKVLETVTKRLEALDAAYEVISRSRYFTSHEDSKPSERATIKWSRYDIQASSKDLFNKSPSNDNADSPMRQRAAPTVVYNLRRSSAVGKVGLNSWFELVDYLRPDLEDIHKEILFYALDEDKTGALSKEEFRDVTAFIEVAFHKKHEGNKTDYTVCNGPYALHVRRFVRAIVTSKAFEYLDGFLIFAFTCLLVADLGANQQYPPLKKSIEALTFTFVFELVIKVVGLGTSEFVEERFNILDSVALTLASVGYISGLMMLQCATFARTLRIIKGAKKLQEFGLVIKTFTSISQTFFRYVIVMFLVYYMFAIIGMEAFAGAIYYKPNSHPPFYEGNAELDSRLNCSAYYENKYWNNNFNNLWTALITLFEQMVVNNWPIVMMAYAYATSRWAMIYFYIWYFVMVIVVLNIVTAFLLDDFMIMRAKINDETNNLKDEWRLRIERVIEEMGYDEHTNPFPYWYSRKTHPIHVYEVMFASDIQDHLLQQGYGEDEDNVFGKDSARQNKRRSTTGSHERLSLGEMGREHTESNLNTISLKKHSTYVGKPTVRDIFESAFEDSPQ